MLQLIKVPVDVWMH